MEMTKWTLDPTHSELQFKIKHLMITTLTGSLRSFKVDVSAAGDDFKNANIYFKGDIDSIETGNTIRDSHLKSDEFFDFQEFPYLEFVSTSVERQGVNYLINGDLTIKGQTKAVNLTAEFNGISVDPWGKTKTAFTLNGKINRFDFGLTWNTNLKTGGVLVGEEVRIISELQFVEQI